MPASPVSEWRKEFGLEGKEPPSFFSSPGDIDAAGDGAPVPHVLRRAFDELRLDGIFCLERSPIIYFREVERIEPPEVFRLQRVFWNQGVAPILVLITATQVHVYSGLIAPAAGSGETAAGHGFVETLNRVRDELHRFILAVESGEYFHTHRRSFDPRQRVDRSLLRNLQAAREALDEVPAGKLAPQTLDALLCRLVFTCYLFDRGIIDRSYLESAGIMEADHLRDVLRQRSRTKTKEDLYTRLFDQLRRDFNGDLFSDDLEAEAKEVRAGHLDILDRFFHAADVRSGQRAFWPYDFGVIPIETVSAIYEHFLKAAGSTEKKKVGAFYTPRFLAELALDIALEGVPTLLDKRFLDPACGSGIFLVGLFNRLAEEWKRNHPRARYDRRAAGLMQILQENLFGGDRNPTACRITAFSLYLAFLDQLSPPDIRELQRKGKVLPYLVYSPAAGGEEAHGGTIRCADFFTPDANPPLQVHIVVGNPPWASVTDRNAPVARWCAEQSKPFPDRQLATAFIWKAPDHLETGGKVCFVLPHGTIFNHNPPAVVAQQRWMRQHAVELILNLADYQRFLFAEAEAPAVVARYRKEPPIDSGHRIDYWAPKTDWTVTQAEVITTLPQDRWRLTVREVLEDLKGEDAPLIWKQRFWATPRDWRLLDRLSLLPRLRDITGQPAARDRKRWLIAEGFQPHGKNDPPESLKRLTLPNTAFIKASSPSLNLVLLPNDCDALPSREIEVRRLIRNTDIFRKPHVLITEGFSKVAFADFDMAFQDAVRGLHGPADDYELLMFLTAFLRSPLARYFLFHTSSSWGVNRARVDVEELLRLPFPLPEQAHNPKRCRAIVQEVARIVTDATEQAKGAVIGRDEIVGSAQADAEKLVEEYFDVDKIERMLIRDTNEVIVPSVRPTRARTAVPTLAPATPEQREGYIRVLSNSLNSWARAEYEVRAKVTANTLIGVGLVILEKVRRGEAPAELDKVPSDIVVVLDQLQRAAAKEDGSYQLTRGLKVFDRNLLYITKPLGQRFWTCTAALNDADEIAATVLMQPAREGA